MRLSPEQFQWRLENRISGAYEIKEPAVGRTWKAQVRRNAANTCENCDRETEFLFEGSPGKVCQRCRPLSDLESKEKIRDILHESRYVEMKFPCDTFTYWKDNVRAVALALEALRKIDRYGVRSGSQYAGFKALPPGGFTVGMTPELAADFIAKAAGMGNVPGIATSVISNVLFGESVYKTAAKLLHPDKGGDAEEFKKLDAAWRCVKEVQKARAASENS